jgi:hypothetical protein
MNAAIKDSVIGNAQPLPKLGRTFLVPDKRSHRKVLKLGHAPIWSVSTNVEYPIIVELTGDGASSSSKVWKLKEYTDMLASHLAFLQTHGKRKTF